MTATATRAARVRGQPQSTRAAYRDVLIDLLASDGRVVCLDTDTGLFDRADLGPGAERYVNLGIAEHNLMGVAAGLALSGRLPFVNTMATFAATRALEAIKVDIAFANLPVRIAATHGGLSAGHFGPTHHALEDLAIMRVLPNMTVVVPADAAAVEAAVLEGLEIDGPLYLRLGRNPTPVLDVDAGPPRLGRAQQLREGADVALVACGPHPVLAALEAAGALARAGIAAAVLNVHTLKPLDAAAIVAAAETAGALVTVEEHWPAGGLGAAVAEVVTEHAPCPVARVCVPEGFVDVGGSHEQLLARCGLTAEAVSARATSLLRGGRGPAGAHPAPPTSPPPTPRPREEP